MTKLQEALQARAKEICYAHYDHLGMLRPYFEDCAKGEQENYLFFAKREIALVEECEQLKMFKKGLGIADTALWEFQTRNAKTETQLAIAVTALAGCSVNSCMEALSAIEALQDGVKMDKCICGEINARNCGVHNEN